MASKTSSEIAETVQSAREAQRTWMRVPVRERVGVVRRVRDLVAQEARQLLPLFPEELGRQPGESLTAEVVPFAEACRFAELSAESLLLPRKVNKRGRPLWLRGVQMMEHREPHGVVLIIGPANYPFYLPGVQIVQALVAGNAVLVKPGTGGATLMRALRSFLTRAGLPDQLFSVLDEAVQAAHEAMEAGVDKVVLTGSVPAGRAVLRAAAESVTPVVAELSGDDPFVVLDSADVPKALAALQFARRLNRGQTCIAPSRIFVQRRVSAEVVSRYPEAVVFDKVSELAGAANDSPFALGATIFGEEQEALKAAQGIAAGVVVINDVIVPTADPRLSFGGRKRSGFGKTRGAEGLLEMTVSKTLIVQKAKRLRHLEGVPPQGEELFLSFLRAQHRSKLLDRWKGWLDVCKVAQRIRKQ